ncbi:MAG: hypothetical protein VKK04_10190 [Synechococcales bacterium]|nr:hypothetical protein [Synechococcales bacterium]
MTTGFTSLTSEDSAAWQTRASFLLEFQTRAVEEALEEQTSVVFQETTEQRTFPGLGGEPVQNWMLEKYRSSLSASTPSPMPSIELGGLTVELEAEVTPTAEPESPPAEAPSPALEEPQLEEPQLEEPQPEAGAPTVEATADQPPAQPEVLLTLNVLKVRLFQPPNSGKPIVISNGIYSTPSPLLAKKLLDLEIFFELPELARMALPSSVSYSLKGFAKSIDSPGLVLPLGESNPCVLEDYRSRYQTILPKISLPAGLYRIQLLIDFIGAPIPFGFYDIPRFQVVQ